MSNDFKPETSNRFEYIDFVNSVNPDYAEKRVFWDNEKKCLSYYNDELDMIVNVGQEFIIPVRNETGFDIPNGAIVYPSGASGGKVLIDLANASIKGKCRLVGMATHTIENNTDGYVTRLGEVGGLDTSLYSSGGILYLSATDNGEFTDVVPDDGAYTTAIGAVKNVDGENGSIVVDPQVSELTVEVTATNGFPEDQRTNTTISVVNGTRTFSIAPTGSEFHYYVTGDKYEQTTTQSVIFNDTEGNHWIYFDNTGIQKVYNPTDEQKKDIITKYAFVSYFYWNVTDKEVVFDIFDERHDIDMSAATHFYLHKHEGSRYTSGYATGDIIADATGSLDTHAQFSITSGSFDDEDLSHTSSVFSVGDTLEVAYISGSGLSRIDTKTNFAVITTGTGRLAYNLNTTGTWSVEEVGNGNFCLYHFFGINGANKQLISVMGQNEYPTISQARIGASTEIADIASSFEAEEGVPISTIIFETKDLYSNSVKARIRTTDTGEDYIDWRTSELAQGSVASSHSNLTELDVDDHLHYSLVNGTRDYTGIISYDSHPTFTIDTEIVDKKYVDDNSGGSISFEGRDLISFTNSTNDALDFDSSFLFNRSTTNNEVTLDVLEYTPTADASAPLAVEGYMYYNSDYDAITVYPDIAPDGNFRGIFLGKMMFMHVYNDTGSTLLRGRCVAFNSAFSTTLPTVVLADADTHTAVDVVGMVVKNISDSSAGIICTNGWLVNTDLDYITSPTPTSNDTLYLSDTAGELSLSVPSSPANPVIIGKYLNVSGAEHNIFINTMDVTGTGGDTEFDDSVFRVQDNGDDTKQLAFECSGITTATTQTLTVPDASGEMTLNTATQTLTAKTLTSAVLNTGVGGTAVLDEDDMATDSATQIATQQSIKAYSDASKLSGYSVSSKNTDLSRNSGNTGQIDFTADILICGDYKLTSISESIDDGASTGVGFIDTGTVSANTWYSQIIVYNPATADAGMIYSLLEESTNLPAGYTQQRHIGWVRYATTDWNEDRLFCAFREYQPANETINISSGLSTVTATDYQLDVSAYLPPCAYSCTVTLRISTDRSGGGDIFLVRPSVNATGASGAIVYTQVASKDNTSGGFAGLNASGELTYRFIYTGGSLAYTIFIAGFNQKC